MSKSAPQKQTQKKTPSTREWMRAHRLASALIGAGVLALIALLVLNHFDAFHSLYGRLRCYNGKVYGAEPNQVISRVTRGRGRDYYVSGTFTEPEDYEADAEFAVQIDKNLRAWAYRDNTGGSIYLMSVQGGPTDALTARETQMQGYTGVNEEGETVVKGIPFEGDNAKGIHYYGAVGPLEIEPYASDGNYFRKQCFVFLDTAKNRNVFVGVFAKSKSGTGIASDEEMIARAMEFAELVDKP